MHRGDPAAPRPPPEGPRLTKPRTDDELMAEAAARGWFAVVTEWLWKTPLTSYAAVGTWGERVYEAEADTMNAALNAAMDQARASA